jgi:hypothetical protein
MIAKGPESLSFKKHKETVDDPIGQQQKIMHEIVHAREQRCFVRSLRCNSPC